MQDLENDDNSISKTAIVFIIIGSIAIAGAIGFAIFKIKTGKKFKGI